MFSAIRSSKLVSVRLKAVVCEFAMLPEIFSSANDCARMPVTAVVELKALRRRPLEAGNRYFNQNVDTYHWSGGFKGYFNMMGGEWDWDVSVQQPHADHGRNLPVDRLLFG